MATESLVDIYGKEFLAYLYAIPEGKEIDQTTLNTNKEVTNTLLQASANIAPDNDSQGIPIAMQLPGFSNFDPRAQTSIVNMIRMHCGGSIPEVPESEDQVFYFLSRLLRDIWPVFLLPSNPKFHSGLAWPDIPAGMYRNPALTELFNAVLIDPDLKNLFTDIPNKTPTGTGGFIEYSKISSMIDFNTGSGGGYQIYHYPSGIINYCAQRAKIKHDTLSWERIISELASAIEISRRLAKKKTAHIPAIMGIDGLQFPKGASVHLKSGTLRAPSDFERNHLMAEAGSVTTIFETTFPARILEINSTDETDEDFDSRMEQLTSQTDITRRDFEKEFQLTRLSLLLASQGRDHLTASEVSRYIMNPLSSGGSMSLALHQNAIARHQVTAEQISDITEWEKDIRKNHSKSLDIGMKRILSACTSRSDPNDAFVDALICWENAFGAAGETTFRVTRSIAKLLQSNDKEKRSELIKELVELYRKRSLLVHGSHEPNFREAQEYKNRSIEIGIDCLRVLYRDRDDLLKYADSGARGEALLLE